MCLSNDGILFISKTTQSAIIRKPLDASDRVIVPHSASHRI
jgi:hypothetical protein